MHDTRFHPAGLRVRDVSRQRGAILILALLVMVVLTGLVLVYARSMRVQLQAAANRADAAEAMQIAMGAIEAVLAMDQNVPVQAVPVGRGGYWILRFEDAEDQVHHFGLTDEAGKLNLNVAPPPMLALLPGSDDDLAAAIVTWRGDDGGAADDGYYLSLSDPYQAKGEAFETVEELLLVRGMTPQRLYGNDANLSGLIDPHEHPGGRTMPLGLLGGRDEQFGMRPFVTVYSRPLTAGGGGVDDDEQADAEPVVNVNRATVERLAALLADIADAPDRAAQAIRDNRPHRNLIDLFYASTLDIAQFAQFEPRVRVAGAGGGGTEGEERGEASLPVPINVSTAPRAVLATLPVLEPADADALVTHRQMLRDTGQYDLLQTAAWITEVLDRDKAIAAGDYLVARGQQRSADIVALSGSGRAFERIRIVYDMADAEPRLLAWHRLTHLGWPLDPALREDPVFDGTVISDEQLGY